ncbi:MAG: SDR family oxidoreductase [Clostridia bacterium]|nr:SDR family oxidoreductase [Clostridia bacterium]
MNIVITGASRGIGLAAAHAFLEKGHAVYGIDLLPAHPSFAGKAYTHFVADIRDGSSLPDLPDVNVLFNNAGMQNSEDDIDLNLKGTIAVTEKYIRHPENLRSVLFNASASSVTGKEFPLYAASKAGVVGYMKNVAVRLAPYGVTVNAVSFGGVLTELNEPVVRDAKLWDDIMRVTPLKKWMTPEEAADWAVFLTLTNKSMSGQNLLIDNGETGLNDTFVWPDA